MGDVYVDMNSETGSLTGANWQFTNGSTTVTETGAVGNAVAELSAGDYVRTTGGLEWYKVASITDDDNFEIAINFQQANVTAVCKYNSEDGSAIGQAFAHHNQATTDTARTAGDTIYTRANLTYTYAGLHITFDESGTPNSYITLLGCDSVTDPWSDGSDVKPIIDFGATAFHTFLQRNYWKILNIEFTGSTHGFGALYSTGFWGIVEKCRFQGNTQSGLTVRARTYTVIDCEFYDNTGRGIYAYTSNPRIIGCTFNGGTGGTAYGLYAPHAGQTMVSNSTFGSTTEHSAADLYTAGTAVRGKNIILDSSTEVFVAYHGSIKIIDNEQTKGEWKAWYWNGQSTKISAPGGGGFNSSDAEEITPNSSCGSEQPIYFLGGDWLEGMELYLPASQVTVSIKAQCSSWASIPTNSEFYFELLYFAGATAERSSAVSTEVFAANDTTKEFTITVTPNSAGIAYLRGVLKDYEDGTETIISDIIPMINGGVIDGVSWSIDGPEAHYDPRGKRRTRAQYHV